MSIKRRCFREANTLLHWLACIILSRRTQLPYIETVVVLEPASYLFVMGSCVSHESRAMGRLARQIIQSGRTQALRLQRCMYLGNTLGICCHEHARRSLESAERGRQLTKVASSRFLRHILETLIMEDTR